MTVKTFVFNTLQTASLLLVAACVPVEFLSDVPEELEATAGALVIGETTRKELHADLGEPLAASSDGTIEVIRAASGHDINWVVWLGPLPPMFTRSDVTGYLMLRYDAGGVVSEATKGFTAKHEPEYDTDRGERRDLTLSLPPYEFRARYVGQAYEESLLAPLPKRWPPLPSGQCRMLFVPNTSLLSSISHFTRKLHIDDTVALTYRPVLEPSAMDAWILFQFVLPLGRHQVTVEVEHYEEDRFETDWSCSQDEIVQLYDRIEWGRRPDRDDFWHSAYGPVGSLQVGPDVNLKSSTGKLVVFHSGVVRELEQQD